MGWQGSPFPRLRMVGEAATKAAAPGGVLAGIVCVQDSGDKGQVWGRDAGAASRRPRLGCGPSWGSQGWSAGQAGGPSPEALGAAACTRPGEQAV